ncbi:MAG TPA: tetratricopeptide repeat-containing protein kinase family protein, partial [Longimicrobiales bacterium]|nr:tetratricopeptide repeat-containing protein kinase family protein [Longimicrobiales bacterium]
LKPQNVLVTSQGQAKLLDFGIARLLDAGGEEFHTATALPNPMTVAYASPEQIRGRPLSTATDVYGLGLLLYQLVTGRLPYELDGVSAGEAERIICTTEPLPPHRAPAGAPGVTGSGDATPDAVELARRRSVDEARLRRELSGDLERILLMALRKEPERRYASASALADDLRRYLAGLPVSARADTTAYRFRRFVARNRGAVAAGSMLAILALALAGLAVRYTLETRSAAERIAREADITREVTEFLLGVLALSDPGEGRGDTLTVRAALERGVAKYGEVLRDRPELRARMLETMARGYSGLGLDAEAAPLLEETLALRPATGTAADTLRIATLFQISDLYFRRGQYPESVRTGEEALESVAGLGGDSVRIALSLGIMARGLTRVPLLDSARLLGSRALGILRRHAGPDAPSTLQAGLAYAHTLRLMEEPDSAEALLREILAGIEAGGEDVSPLGPEAANNLGYLLRVRGRPAESAKMYRLALDRFDHWMPPTQRLITLNNLAALQDEMGNPSEAEATLRAHLALARETWPGGNWRVGSSASALATLLLWNGRTAEAVPLLQEAMEVYTRTLGPTHGWTANAESRLGKALSEVGRADEAEPLLVGSFETLLAGPGPEDRWTLEALERLTSFLDGQGRAAEASRYRRRIGADG